MEPVTLMGEQSREIPDDDQARRGAEWGDPSAAVGRHGRVRYRKHEEREIKGYGRSQAQLGGFPYSFEGQTADHNRWAVHRDQGGGWRLCPGRGRLQRRGDDTGSAVHGAAPGALAGIRVRVRDTAAGELGS